MASLPEARRIKSPPGWEDAKEVMSSTMWRVGPLGAVLADDNEDSWRATHADEGEVWAASSDLVMLLRPAAAVFESVAEEDKDDALALAAAWLGLHMIMNGYYYGTCERRLWQ